MNRETPARLRPVPWLLIALLLISGCTAGLKRSPGGAPEQPAPATPAAEEAVADPQPEADTAAGQTDPAAPQDPPVAGAVAADLDGDGRPEYIRGLSDNWTTDPVVVYDAGGQPLFTWETFGWERRVSVHHLAELSRSVLLEWRRYENGNTAVGIRTFTSDRGEFSPAHLYGWGLKHADTTPATRATLAEDGTLLVEWDMGDPARHTRVRQYEVDLAQNHVRIVSETFQPEGAELVYPDAPEAVLRAAHLAATYGLDDELPRYFASDDAMNAFREAVKPVPYEVTGVHLARAAAIDEYCVPQLESAQPDDEGAAPFVITVGGSITVDTTLGTVWFGADEAGRPVIRDFRVQRRCPASAG